MELPDDIAAVLAGALELFFAGWELIGISSAFFIGFAVGLFGAEFVRRERDWRAAGTASLYALRAVGLGILLEFLLAGLAISAFLIGSLAYFVF